MAGYVIYLLLTLCLCSLIFGYPNLDARQKRQAKGIQSCTTSAGSRGECLPFRKCSIECKKYGRPAVCRWDTFGPVICCPITTEADSTTSEKTEPLRKTISTTTEKTEPLRKTISTTTEKTEPLPCGDPFTAFGVVVGGQDAPIAKWPWMALIFLEEDVERKIPICGATLISLQTVLTAAHCFIGRPNSKLIIRLGEHNLAESGGQDQPIEIKVTKIVIHSNFRYPSLYNDIAILHLESKVELTDMIRLVCMPKGHESETFVSQTAVVTGWGHLEFGGIGAHTLQELELPVITNDQCQKKYESLLGSTTNLPRGIIDSIMCAGVDNEKKDACQGDSGGPLVVEADTGNWIQIGIVSAGFECGAGIPGLYTRVTSHLDWIAENTI